MQPASSSSSSSHKKHKKEKKNKKDKREKGYRKYENLSNNGEVDSISGQSGSNPAHPVPTPLNIKVEPTVAEEVNDSKFEKFKTALLKFFKAKRQENLPMEKVKKAIIEMTSLTEEQLMTCIEKGSDLNLITIASGVLYLNAKVETSMGFQASEVHAISSYKDHLYEVQILNPPEFKDHQYWILKN